MRSETSFKWHQLVRRITRYCATCIMHPLARGVSFHFAPVAEHLSFLVHNGLRDRMPFNVQRRRKYIADWLQVNIRHEPDGVALEDSDPLLVWRDFFLDKVLSSTDQTELQAKLILRTHLKCDWTAPTIVLHGPLDLLTFTNTTKCAWHNLRISSACMHRAGGHQRTMRFGNSHYERIATSD